MTLLSLRLFDPVALLPPCPAACDYAGSSMAKVVPTQVEPPQLIKQNTHYESPAFGSKELEEHINKICSFFVYRRIESGKENKNALPDWGKEKQKGCLSMFNMEDNLFT